MLLWSSSKHGNDIKASRPRITSHSRSGTELRERTLGVQGIRNLSTEIGRSKTFADEIAESDFAPKTFVFARHSA